MGVDAFVRWLPEPYSYYSRLPSSVDPAIAETRRAVEPVIEQAGPFSGLLRFWVDQKFGEALQYEGSAIPPEQRFVDFFVGAGQLGWFMATFPLDPTGHVEQWKRGEVVTTATQREWERRTTPEVRRQAAEFAVETFVTWAPWSPVPYFPKAVGRNIRFLRVAFGSMDPDKAILWVIKRWPWLKKALWIPILRANKTMPRRQLALFFLTLDWNLYAIWTAFATPIIQGLFDVFFPDPLPPDVGIDPPETFKPPTPLDGGVPKKKGDIGAANAAARRAGWKPFTKMNAAQKKAFRAALHGKKKKGRAAARTFDPSMLWPGASPFGLLANGEGVNAT